MERAMIERHVYIKLNDDLAQEQGRAEVAAKSRELATIPGVLRLDVGLPADPASLAAWDLCLRLEFESLEAVEAYRVHPDHVRYLDFLATRAAARKAWNFRV